MGKDTGFLEANREKLPRRPVAERTRDYQEYDGLYPEAAIRKQASRCMDCGIPFCHTGCPLGNMIPDWNDLVYRGRWREALEVLHSTNNFPEFTGRICPAPCESECVLKQYYREEAVTIEYVEKHIADRGWQEGWIKPIPPKELTGKTVAIIGSGPAGMAAAQQLGRVGHRVTVFEKEDRIGGLLTYGIPDFKLDKLNVKRRVAQMEAEGVVFKTQVAVGTDVTLAQLRQQYDAVIIATGAQFPRVLTVPGQDLKGVHYAMEYLPQQNRVNAGDVISNAERILAQGKTVAILGGGFTGADCLGTLNRQGAKRRVHQYELFNMAPRPTPVHEEAEMDCQGEVLTYRLSGQNGHVSDLHAFKVKWEKQSDGRMLLQLVDEFRLPVEMIHLATGFLGPNPVGFEDVTYTVRGQPGKFSGTELHQLLQKNIQEEKDFWQRYQHGTAIYADELLRQPMFAMDSNKKFKTNLDNVFVAGDARRGASLVVWAIWEGRETARCVDEYLMGTTELPSSPQTISVT